MAVYFHGKLRKLKLQIYQSIGLAKVREKPLANVQNRENRVWGEREIPLLGEDVFQKRSRTTACKIIHTRMAEPPAPTPFNQVLSLGASQALKNYSFW